MRSLPSSNQPDRVRRLRDDLLALAKLWAERTGRSTGALSSVVANHGGVLDRLTDPAKAVTDATLEKFAGFLCDPANWPDGQVPEEAAAFAHRVGVSAAAPALANGKTGKISGEAAVQAAGQASSGVAA